MSDTPKTDTPALERWCWYEVAGEGVVQCLGHSDDPGWIWVVAPEGKPTEVRARNVVRKVASPGLPPGERNLGTPLEDSVVIAQQAERIRELDEAEDEAIEARDAAHEHLDTILGFVRPGQEWTSMYSHSDLVTDVDQHVQSFGPCDRC